MSRFPILLIAGLTACSPAAEPAAKAATAAPPASSSAPAAPSGGTLTIKSHGGDEIATVTSGAGGAIDLTFTEGGKKTTLRGVSKDGVKRKYSAGGDVLFEVKGDDDGFKLRTPAGALLYKVKFYDDKVKVSDNEENANPFELKMREGDRVKVVGPGEKEMGDVRATVVEDAGGKKLFDLSGRAGSASYGVLLLDKLPPVQRYIVLAELFARGR